MGRTLLVGAAARFASAGAVVSVVRTAPAHPDVGFRGDPAHTGIFAAPALEQFGGVAWRVQTGGPVESSPTVGTAPCMSGAATSCSSGVATARISRWVWLTGGSAGGSTPAPTRRWPGARRRRSRALSRRARDGPGAERRGVRDGSPVGRRRSRRGRHRALPPLPRRRWEGGVAGHTAPGLAQGRPHRRRGLRSGEPPGAAAPPRRGPRPQQLRHLRLSGDRRGPPLGSVRLVGREPVGGYVGGKRGAGLEARGLAAAWVRRYGGPEGTGFVRISGSGADGGPVPNYAEIQAVAEYRPIGREGR